MAAKTRVQYEPDYAVIPGATVLETIESMRISQADLAKRTGRPTKTINEIINGKAAITADTALQFEKVLGVPASFWNNLERNYREALATQNERKALAKIGEWVKPFPVKELMKRKAIPNSTDKVDIARSLLQFFGVSSPEAWSKVWTLPQASYRRSAAFKPTIEATAAWLRLGEIEARKLSLPSFDKGAFKRVLNRLKGIMNLPPSELKIRLIEECRSAGVAVVFVKELKGTRAHGAARWIGENPLIQLSCRYKVEDIFWFSFFHEAGHVVLHGKKDIFLEQDQSDNEKEREADAFASAQLLAEPQWRKFTIAGNFSEAAVTAFANEQGVSPGIVVGRLQHDKKILPSRLNTLKRRFDLTVDEAA
jgi:HTH-type transcriptional regulator / antitoxin HigA